MRLHPILFVFLAVFSNAPAFAAATQAASEGNQLARILAADKSVAESQALPAHAESLPAKRVRKAQRNAVGESEPKPAFQPYQEQEKVGSRRGKVVPGQLLVKFKPDNKGGAQALAKLSATPGVARANRVFPHAQEDDPFPGRRGGVRSNGKSAAAPGQAGGRPLPDLTRWHRVKVTNKNADLLAAAAAMKRMDGVEWAEPVYERRGNGVPDASTDPMYADQWHLDGANVPAAWAYLEGQGKPPGGSSDITVAVIDTGVDYAHSDLVSNMWVNVAEIADNGIDDDGNGFVDDIHGVAVVGSSFDHHGDPQDDNGHGTHVAGIIAATGDNGIGGTGIAYGVKIMAIKAAQYSGILTTADIAEGIYYAAAQGADVINMSFGGYGRSYVEEDALAVAFGTSVLVAAAGNDAIANQPCPIIGAPLYPAAYSWVLGVMASQENSDAQGDYMAGFSNWDCKQKNGLEYELMAPGSQVWSTLPGEGYSGWGGTSMATPVAAGVAALLRTQWSDKSVYSSRFIMGQVAGTGPAQQAFTPLVGLSVSYKKADALEALTNTPKPSLAYLEHWIWDTTAQDAGNDDDGIVDAGETIDLAIVVKNHWGKGDPVSVTLAPWADGAVGPDPYVTMITDTVDYGAVGSFNQDDNGLIYDAEGAVTGVTSPFQFSVASNTPNDHMIPFRLTMTAGNGLDPNDAQTYTTTSYFFLVVQRGRQLPSVIDSDAIGTEGGNVDTDGIEDGIVTLDDSSLWIIDKPVLVYPDIELKVTEGAQVQFWSTQPDDAYAVFRNSYLQVEGTLTVQGTAERPVIMGPSELFSERMVVIKQQANGVVNMSHSRVINAYLTGMQHNGDLSHLDLVRNYGDYTGGLYFEKNGSGSWSQAVPSVDAALQLSRAHRLAREYPYQEPWEYDWDQWKFSLAYGSVGNLFDSTATVSYSTSGTGNVFLKGAQKFIDANGRPNGIRSSFSGGALNAVNGGKIVKMGEYGGKTYGFLYSRLYTTTDAERLEDARSIAQFLGGDLLVVNDEAEKNFLFQTYADFYNRTAEDWQAQEDPFCKVSGTDNYCSDLIRNYPAIGLLNNGDDTFSWINGESSSLGWPEDQYYYSSVNGSGEFTYPRTSVAALIVPSFFGGETDLPSRYLGLPNSSNILFFLVELPGSLSYQELDQAVAAFMDSQVRSPFRNNAILNVWHDLNADHWLTLTASGNDTTRRWDLSADVSGNFWGTTSTTLVSTAITEYFDDFNLLPVKYTPILEVAPETAYPFVVDVVFTDVNGVELQGNRFGSEVINWTVTFNRDMDTTIQPNVWFGPTEPFTDFGVPGDWVDARTWQGSFNITPVTGDGWQYVYIRGAVAADDPWLVTGHDSERFRFEIITSGTEALTLQATGGVDKVDLSWVQDDFDLLHGYNVYRSLDPDGSFTRINGVVIPVGTNTYSDTNVAPGVDHYYRFTVVSDRGESDYSNTAVAQPVDTVPPVISHTPVLETVAGSNRTLTATITDNIAVQSATLFYRAVGETNYLSRTMVNTPVDQYSATLEGSLLQPPGVDYYLSATDGTNTVTHGSAASPYRLAVGDADRDGMPDDWENAFGLNASDPADADADRDNDGLANIDEYQAGTDPTDPDTDGDGVSDNVDAFPLDPAESLDTDGDGIGDNADPDDDGDGVADGVDNCPLVDNADQVDSDGDGRGDVCDGFVRSDYNADGSSDVLLRNNATGQNWMYLMDGATVASSIGVNTVPLAWTISGTGDYNGDGKADILWRNGGSGQNWLYLMDGATIVSSAGVNTVANPDWQVAGNGDYNGDGKSDILWRNNSSGQNWMYLMDGATIISSVNVNTVPTIWQVAGSGDYDGDGKSDILWRHGGSGQNWLYRMDGATITSSVGINNVPTIWSFAGDGDYNGDGKADILWRHTGSGQVWMYLMDGSVISGSQAVGTIPTAWNIVGDGDYNGDGKSDILWRNSTTGQNWMYLMDGASITTSSEVNKVSDLNWRVINTN